ncbi:MAG TPA: hypothetical protein VGA17_02665, partial [Nitrospiraceae bacterium]
MTRRAPGTRQFTRPGSITGTIPCVLALSFSLWLPATVTGEPAAAQAEPGGLHLLEELQSVITDLAERVKPSVVSVGAIRPKDSLRDRPPNAPGSG